ncbi:hypothetical protein C8I07_20905 [Shewanella baltica]|nr:hypothetical protein C8I07_20905 [Shewanella baltica]
MNDSHFLLWPVNKIKYALSHLTESSVLHILSHVARYNFIYNIELMVLSACNAMLLFKNKRLKTR